VKERSYANLADSATTFDPEFEFDKQVDRLLEEIRKEIKSAKETQKEIKQIGGFK
jgi:hypothetical protein